MAVESLLSITSFTSSLWILILRAWTILLEKKRVTVRRLLHLLLNAHASLGPVLLRNLKDTGLTGLRLFFGGWYSLYGSCYGYLSFFCVCSLNEARELLRAQEGANTGHVLARLTLANTMMFPTVLLIEDAALLRSVDASHCCSVMFVCLKPFLFCFTGSSSCYRDLHRSNFWFFPQGYASSSISIGSFWNIVIMVLSFQSQA